MAERPRLSIAISLSQAAMLTRLASLVLVPLFADIRSGTLILAMAAIATSSFLGLRADNLRLATEHPLIALVDLVVVSGATAYHGLNSPLILATLTTALLVGIWVPIGSGVLVMFMQLFLYFAGVKVTLGAVGISTLSIAVLPFVYLMLWVLGMVVRRASDNEEASRHALDEAIAAAAAAEERRRVARELHDRLAKSIQAISLTAQAVSRRLADADPRTARLATQLSATCATAVDDARELMSDWRREPAGLATFDDQVRQLVRGHEAETGRRVLLTVHGDGDVTSNEVRYELCACVKEALRNVASHAGECTVTVDVQHGPDDVQVCIADTGRGVLTGPDRLPIAPRAHFGVTGMRERMESLGGSLRFESEPGSGTRVVLRAHSAGLVEVSMKEHT